MVMTWGKPSVDIQICWHRWKEYPPVGDEDVLSRAVRECGGGANNSRSIFERANILQFHSNSNFYFIIV